MNDLTIKEVRTTLLRMPWQEDPWLAGHALGATRDLVVVEVVTASGITGMGYLHLLGLPLQRTIAACIAEAMAPRVIGRPATDVEAIWRDLWRTTLTGGRGGVTMMAQSAIDIALWDVVGKSAGLPLHRLWGHYRSEIPIYGSGCFRGAYGDGMIAKAQHFVAQGYKAIKMQVAHIGDVRTDIDNVR
ncbi:MAG: mandelate racemase / L-alanine-DL-glutamate epimerase, partial [Belnapia sp.]|nr:mandelate racemase / L-alanine-DL-glutamate epimerase [Belnapia sp.]